MKQLIPRKAESPSAWKVGHCFFTLIEISEVTKRLVNLKQIFHILKKKYSTEKHFL